MLLLQSLKTRVPVGNLQLLNLIWDILRVQFQPYDIVLIVFLFLFRMYDVDGNGVIDQDEMTKIVQAIYDMLGAGATKPTDSAEDRAKNIFSRMDENGDGHLTEEEFLRGCLQDEELSKMLAPNVVQ